MTSLVLDTGALVALERGNARVRALLERALHRDARLIIPAPVVAQAWRGGPRQAVIAALLKRADIVAMTSALAKDVGVLAGRSGHPDVIDVMVALVAHRTGSKVVTSDPADISRVVPSLSLVIV